MIEKSFIDHKTISLEEWLNYVNVKRDDRNFLILDCQFATDQHRDQYLKTVHDRSDSEIKYLLSLFLIETGHLGYDRNIRDWLFALPNEKFNKAISKNSFLERVVFASDKHPPWITIYWIVDLLPNYPQEAIQVIHAYSQAHIQHLPDTRIFGLSDAVALIRAKYIEHTLPVKQILLDLTSRDFELLVAYLYTKKGYKVQITPRSHDGGYDVIAEKYSDREQERLHIECKRYDQNVGVDIARKTLGTLNIENATKAVLVASTYFTKPAKDAAYKSKRLELINLDNFDQEMRKHIDMHWISKIPEYLMKIKKGITEN